MKKTYSERNEVRSHIIGVPLNDEEKRSLEEFAKKQGLTKAGFLRMILITEIEKSKNKE